MPLPNEPLRPDLRGSSEEVPNAHPDNGSSTPEIPDHTLVRCIARGSYGEVWLARNLMGVYRAVKIIRRSNFTDERPFQRELEGIKHFEPVSRTHEGLVAVLHLGSDTSAGYFYYIMELADDVERGQEIDPETYWPHTLSYDLEKRGKYPVNECIDLALALSGALEHMHHRGLLHRDVKPSNIIFINGRPKLADIGLVAAIKSDLSYVGTEGFIPPEGTGSPQGDIYSLGKALYEISTGKDRYRFPEPPSVVQQDQGVLFSELNAVIVRACHPNVSERYSTASDLRRDLAALLNGKSIRKLRALERRLQAIKRYSLTVGSLLLLVGVFGYYINLQWQRAAEQNQRAAGRSVAYGTDDMEDGNFANALPWFVHALELQEDEFLESDHRLRIASVLDRCPTLNRVWATEGKAHHVNFSPDGSRMVVAVYNGKARVRDAVTGELLTPPFGPDTGLQTARFSPDGEKIVTASQHESVSLWDAATGKREHEFDQSANFYDARFSPDGSRIIAAGTDNVARVWSVKDKHRLLALKHEGDVNTAVFSHNGEWIATASRDHSAQIWNARTGAPAGAFLPHPSWVFDVAFSPDDQWLATACFDRKIRVWRVDTGEQILPAMRHGDGVRTVEFSPDGNYILSGSYDGTARLWDATTHSPISVNPVLKHSGAVFEATFAPDGQRVAVASFDGTAWIWNLAGSLVIPDSSDLLLSSDGRRQAIPHQTKVEIQEFGDSTQKFPLIELEGTPLETRLNRTGEFLLTRTKPDTNHFQVWDVASGNPRGTPLPFIGNLAEVTLSDDGRLAALVSSKEVQIIDVQSGRPVTAPMVHSEPIEQAAFAPDGTSLLTMTTNVVNLWNGETGKKRVSAVESEFNFTHAAFNADGSLFLTCSADMTLTPCPVQVWDAQTGNPVGEPLYHQDGVLYAAFSPDNTRIVTASEDFTAVVWDLTTGRPITQPMKHDHQVYQAVFSPDGRWVATVSQDKTARIWDTRDGEPLTTPLPHRKPVHEVQFSGDVRCLITRFDDGSTRRWPIQRDTRPKADLVQLAALLNGSLYSPTSPQISIWSDPAKIEAAWHRLVEKYPETFEVSQKEHIAWHEWQKRRSDEARNALGVRFHSDRLAVLTSDRLAGQSP